MTIRTATFVAFDFDDASRDGALREIIEQHGGTVARAVGSSVLAVSPSASIALDIAVDAQRTLAHGDTDVTARIGISVGDAFELDGVWTGTPVLEAVGLAGSAAPGQILAADLVVRLGGTIVRHRSVDAGETRLRGMVESVHFLAVQWAEDAPRLLTVVIADDSALLRSGTAGVLSANGFQVVGEAGDADLLLELVASLDPDLAIVDIRMPPTHTLEGIRAAARIRSEHPRTGVLILSQHLESQAGLALLSDYEQRIGYLLKDRVGDIEEFLEALRTIASGGTAIDPDVVRRLVGRRRVNDPIEDLTAREVDVLSLMAEGRSNPSIADRLDLSLRTVETHIASIFSKLALDPEPDGHRRVLAVIAFLRRA